MSDTRRWRVLFADDDPTASLLVKAALGIRFDVTAVSNGLDALTSFSQEMFDIVLLDVEMPGMNGFDVGAAIRQRAGTAVPLLLVTGRNDAEFAARCAALAAGHLAKPVNWQTLPEHLLKVLDKA